jgi:ubiquinone/menaquinone biosynthesis C-methylase UbiE
MSTPELQAQSVPPGNPESDEWQRVYRDPQLVGRRLRTHRRKLAWLGAFSWPRDAVLLDLCCGSGEALRILHTAGFSKLHGLDMATDSRLAREPWLNFKAGDGRSLPYPSETFDAVLCMHSLHHFGGLEGIRTALHEVLRILKPGGRLALLDHYRAPQVWAAFWGVRQRWLMWPTSGLRSFYMQHQEEWPYLSEYLRTFPEIRSVIDSLGCEPQIDRKGLFFFYWTGRKR